MHLWAVCSVPLLLLAPAAADTSAPGRVGALRTRSSAVLEVRGTSGWRSNSLMRSERLFDDEERDDSAHQYDYDDNGRRHEDFLAECKDNAQFLDEKESVLRGWSGKCTAWVGKDCTAADTERGFSAAGKADLLKNCPETCKICSKDVKVGDKVLVDYEGTVYEAMLKSQHANGNFTILYDTDDSYEENVPLSRIKRYVKPPGPVAEPPLQDMCSVPHEKCAKSFEFKGIVVHGCTTKDSDTPWCCEDSTCSGSSTWNYCPPCETKCENFCAKIPVAHRCDMLDCMQCSECSAGSGGNEHSHALAKANKCDSFCEGVPLADRCVLQDCQRCHSCTSSEGSEPAGTTNMDGCKGFCSALKLDPWSEKCQWTHCKSCQQCYSLNSTPKVAAEKNNLPGLPARSVAAEKNNLPGLPARSHQKSSCEAFCISSAFLAEPWEAKCLWNKCGTCDQCAHRAVVKHTSNSSNATNVSAEWRAVADSIRWTAVADTTNTCEQYRMGVHSDHRTCTDVKNRYFLSSLTLAECKLRCLAKGKSSCSHIEWHALASFQYKEDKPGECFLYHSTCTNTRAYKNEKVCVMTLEPTIIVHPAVRTSNGTTAVNVDQNQATPLDQNQATPLDTEFKKIGNGHCQSTGLEQKKGTVNRKTNTLHACKVKCQQSQTCQFMEFDEGSGGTCHSYNEPDMQPAVAVDGVEPPASKTCWKKVARISDLPLAFKFTRLWPGRCYVDSNDEAVVTNRKVMMLASTVHECKLECEKNTHCRYMEFVGNQDHPEASVCLLYGTGNTPVKGQDHERTDGAVSSCWDRGARLQAGDGDAQSKGLEVKSTQPVQNITALPAVSACDSRVPSWASNTSSFIISPLDMRVPPAERGPDPAIFLGVYQSEDCSGDADFDKSVSHYSNGVCSAVGNMTFCIQCVNDEVDVGHFHMNPALITADMMMELPWDRAVSTRQLDRSDTCGSTCIKLGSNSYRFAWHSAMTSSLCALEPQRGKRQKVHHENAAYIFMYIVPINAILCAIIGFMAAYFQSLSPTPKPPPKKKKAGFQRSSGPSFIQRSPDIEECPRHICNGRAVVIDAGREMMKVGFAGEVAVKVVTPSAVAKMQQDLSVAPNATMTRTRTEIAASSYACGHKALNKRGVLDIRYPMDRGLVVDWEAMQVIWRHVFCHDLKINPKKHSVLLTEAPMTPQADRDRTASVMLEKFGFQSFHSEVQAVLSLYANGSTSGLVIDCGESRTHAVPVHQGCVIAHAVRSLPLGGQDVTKCLTNLLVQTHAVVEARHHIMDTEFVRNMKEQYCYVALDFEAETHSHSADKASITTEHVCKDGYMLDLSKERYECPELLFDPKLVGENAAGIHELACDCVAFVAGEDVKKTLFANVLLAGGTTLLPGFKERFEKEVQALVPHSAVKVVAPVDRAHSAWLGGSILASCSASRRGWATTDAGDHIDGGTFDAEDQGSPQKGVDAAAPATPAPLDETLQPKVTFAPPTSVDQQVKPTVSFAPPTGADQGVK